MGGTFLTAAFNFIKAVFVGTTAGGAYGFAVNVARIGLLALGSKVLAPKPEFAQQATQKNVTFRDPIAPQQIVYGEDMLSGPMLFANVGGSDNKDLYMAIGLCGHEIDSVQGYRVDSTDIALADVSGSEDGTVGNSNKFDGVAEVELKKGTTSQTVSTLLSTEFASLFGANHTGRGWAYMVWKFSIVEGKEDVFKTQPQNVRAIVRGRKVYDPRLDTSPGANPSNASYIAWSSNPALCLADFLRDDKFGMREEADRIDWDMVVTAANVCEETVSIPGPATQDRYTCNATFLATQNRSEIVEEILGSMMGRLVFSQGVWKMWAGDTVTPDVTLDEANLRGAISLQASSPSAERYNRVRGKYIDPERDYTAATYVEQRSSTYESEDGGEVRELVVDFMSTNNEYEAQRKAIVLLKQSRQQRVVVFEGNFSCFRVQPGATVSLTIDELGFSGEKFFVSDWKLTDDGVDLTLVEEIDSAWADPLVGDYTTRAGSGVLTFGDTGVSPPTSLSGQTVTGGARLTWTNPSQTNFDHIEVWRANENVRGSAVLIGTTGGESFYDPVGDVDRLRYYWIRAVNIFGQVSEWLPNLTTTTVQVYAGFGTQRVVADPFIRLGASYWDVSDGNANYRTGEGTNGTDTVTIQLDSGVTRVLTAQRRGPDEWDALAAGKFTVEITYRVAVRDVGVATAWSLAPIPIVVVTDEGSPANEDSFNGDTSDLHIFTQASTEGEWYDQTVVVEVDDTANIDRSRYLQIGFFGSSLAAPEFEIDFVDAKIVGRPFGGSGQTGLVPDASAANQSTDFLKADGTWAAPGGGGGSSVPASTVASSVLRGDGAGGWIEETDATIDAAGIIKGTTLIARDTTTGDDINISHNGTHVLFDADGTTTDLQVTGFSGRLDLQGGMGLSIRSTGNLDQATIDHDGTDLNIAADAVDVNFTGVSGRIKQGAETLAYLSEAGATVNAGTTNGAMLVWNTGTSEWDETTEVINQAGRLDIITSSGILRLHNTTPVAAERRTDIKMDSTGNFTIIAIDGGGLNSDALFSAIRLNDTWQDVTFHSDTKFTFDANVIAPSFRASDASPGFVVIETDGASNEQQILFANLSGRGSIHTASDAGSFGEYVMEWTRTGTAVNVITIHGDTITLQPDTGNVNIPSNLTADSATLNIKSTGVTDFLSIINTNTQQTLRAPTSNQIRLQVGTDNCIGGAAGGDGIIYGGGISQLSGQTRTTTGVTSGASLFDHAGNERDVGFNHVVEISQTTGSITLDDIHAGAIIRRTGSSNVSVTMAAGSAFPVGSMVTILNHGTGGTHTISDGSEAMYIMDGSGAVTDSTGFALAIGGAITVWRQGASAYYVWGAGIP